MRALVRGERRASLGVMLGLVGLLCLLLGTLVLTLDYRAQLTSVRQTIYTRCLQRLQYDQAAHDGQVANAKVWASLAQIAQQTPIPADADPRVKALFEREQVAINDAKTASQKAADEGVIGGCQVYR